MVIKEEPTGELTVPEAIKKLRHDVGITQAQLATALGIAPTSIYRYEAGTSNPDLETIRHFAKYAMEHGIKWAEQHFVGIVLGEINFSQFVGPIPIKDGVKEGSLAGATVEGRPLTPREQLSVIAFILWMRNNTNDVTENVMRALIDPWMSKAKAEFDAMQDRNSGE